MMSLTAQTATTLDTAADVLGVNNTAASIVLQGKRIRLNGLSMPKKRQITAILHRRITLQEKALSSPQHKVQAGFELQSFTDIIHTLMQLVAELQNNQKLLPSVQDRLILALFTCAQKQNQLLHRYGDKKAEPAASDKLSSLKKSSNSNTQKIKVTSNAKKSPKTAIKPTLPTDTHSLDEDEDEEFDCSDSHFELYKHLQLTVQTDVMLEGLDQVIEIVTLHNGELESLDYCRPGESFFTHLRGSKLCLVKHTQKGSKQVFYTPFPMQLQFRDRLSGELLLEDLSVNKDTAGLIKKYQAEIPDDMAAYLSYGKKQFIIRTVADHISLDIDVPVAEKQPVWQYLLRSSGIHLAILVLMAGYLALSSEPVKAPEPKFVQLDVQQILKKPEPVKPKAKPKPKPKLKPKPRKVTTPTRAKRPVKRPTVKPAVRARPKAVKPVKRDVKKTGLLAALGGAKKVSKSTQMARAQLSQLKATTSASASRRTLQVSGLAENVATGKLNAPTGAVMNTRGSGAALASGSQLASLKAHGAGQRSVQAKVTAAPIRAAKIHGGGISRDAVRRVIDSHMDEVSYCYETALASQSNLSGKIIYDWTIRTDGSVANVGIKSSTIRSVELNDCIRNAIKRWQFPQPSGGDVYISYPFIFDQVGF
ncbi:MAG: AgmX/PglI C-terminal domain-containing protein [Pseudomonadales bacterium]|nr:AgmX/PglI C-terminal domain-containing protein [Pseudomonadales bacterium]